jgi:hypothetical protein
VHVRRTLVLACLALACLSAPAGAAEPAFSVEPAFGVFLHDEDVMGERVDSETAAAAAAGADHARADFLWRAIEPNRGDLRWQVTDRLVEGAARAGLDLLPTLLGTPSWASGVPADAFVPGVFPPRDYADFGRFATALVRRYGPGGGFWAAHPEIPARPVRSWQIWNEPNLPAFWRPAPDPAAYTALLTVAAAAIRAADPQAEIVMAGLPESPLAMPAALYLAGVYRAGGAPAFDTLAVHPYAPDATTVVAMVGAIRGVADAYGDAAPIRVTEFGWATGGEESLLTVPEDVQAALVRDSIVALRTAAPRLNLRGLLYFKWRDRERPLAARDIWPYHAGLVRKDGTAKPALLAYAEAIKAALPEPAAPAKGVRGQAALSLRSRVPTQSARRVRRHGLKVRVGCSRVCRLDAVVSLERAGTRTVRTVVARRSRDLGDVRGRTLTILVPAARVIAARKPGSRLVLRLAARDAAGVAASLAPIRVRLVR